MVQCRIIFNSFCRFEWKRSAVMMVTVEIVTVREAGKWQNWFSRHDRQAILRDSVLLQWICCSKSEWWEWHSRNWNGNQSRKEWKKLKRQKEWGKVNVKEIQGKWALNMQVILRVQDFLRCHEAHVWICHHIHLYHLWPVFGGRSSSLFFLLTWWPT